MADDAIAFLQALGLSTVDLLGFPLGGMVAQRLSSSGPTWSAASSWPAPHPPVTQGPLPQAALEKAAARGKHPKHILFFSPTATSQTAADAFLARLDEPRQQVFNETIGAQITALAKWEQGSSPAGLMRMSRRPGPWCSPSWPVAADTVTVRDSKRFAEPLALPRSCPLYVRDQWISRTHDRIVGGLHRRLEPVAEAGPVECSRSSAWHKRKQIWSAGKGRPTGENPASGLQTARPEPAICHLTCTLSADTGLRARSCPPYVRALAGPGRRNHGQARTLSRVSVAACRAATIAAANFASQPEPTIILVYDSAALV